MERRTCRRNCYRAYYLSRTLCNAPACPKTGRLALLYHLASRGDQQGCGTIEWTAPTAPQHAGSRHNRLATHVIFVGDLDDAARDRIRLVRIDTDFETVYFSSFLLAVLNMGIDRTGRLACACHKLLFVRGGSGTETVNERSSEH